MSLPDNNRTWQANNIINYGGKNMKKFSEDELKVIGVYPTVKEDVNFMPNANHTKLNTPITPRENWIRFFENNDPLWVPDGTYDLNFNLPPINPDTVAQSYSGGVDCFGVKWVPDTSCPDLPAFVEPGFIALKDIEDWRSLKHEDPDKWDWEAVAQAYAVIDQDRFNAFFLQAALFERMINTMGFENAAMSFLEDPDDVEDYLDEILEFDIAIMEHVRKYLKTDLLIFSDDWGAQRSPFFSKNIVEQFLAPRVEKAAKRAHELGMYFMHHCCGNVIDFIPYMIDEGVDSWEFNYGAVKPYLKDAIAKYGDKIKFDGYFNFLEVFPQDEKIFKEGSKKIYDDYGRDKNCSITVYDYYYDWDFDTRAYLYKLARQTYE